MLYAPWMVFLGEHNIKKASLKTSIFEAVKGEKMQKRVVNQCLCRLPPTPDAIPK